MLVYVDGTQYQYLDRWAGVVLFPFIIIILAKNFSQWAFQVRDSHLLDNRIRRYKFATTFPYSCML